ncbi:MAG: hypothetical protein ACJA0M_002217 [Chitinophagales bacterium]|jgi:hypothetical protein
MIDVKIIRELPFSANAVWVVLSNYGDISWTGAPKVEVEGSGIGMVRKVIMDGMAPIEEVLESMNHEAMTYSYTIPRGLPMPVTNYRADVRVEAVNDVSCRVHWHSSAQPNEGSGSDGQQMLEAAYSNMLDGLAQRLKSR